MSNGGTPIILTKSVLHELGPSDFEKLKQNYLVIVPPILLIEILGETHSWLQMWKNPEMDERKLAHKVIKLSGTKHSDYAQSVRDSLFGRETVSSYAQTTEPCSDQFSDTDRQNVLDWKHASARKLAELKPEMTSIPVLAKLTSFEEIAREMDALFKSQNSFVSVEWLCKRIGMSPAEIKEVQERMYKLPRDSQYFHLFAPYAYHCFLVEQVFFQALSNGLLAKGSEEKSYFDLHYAYYFPFTKIFASANEFHKSLWNAFANQKEQEFVEGKSFRSYLR